MKKMMTCGDATYLKRYINLKNEEVGAVPGSNLQSNISSNRTNGNFQPISLQEKNPDQGPGVRI